MMAARSGHGGRNSRCGGQGVSFADWVGASLGDVGVAGWWVRVRSAGRLPAPPSGWQRSQSSEGATELVFPGPALALGKMQSEAARRAGEPSRQSEDRLSPEGLGGHHRLAQTDARRPAGQVLRHHLDGQPGGVRGEVHRLIGNGAGVKGGGSGAHCQVAGHGESVGRHPLQPHVVAPAGEESPLGAVDAAGIVGEDGLQGIGHALVGGAQSRRSGGRAGDDLVASGGGYRRVSGGGIAGRFRRLKAAR